MSTSRPFAYNPSQTNIPGVNLFGYLSVGTIGSGQITGLTTWNGPDEDLGYVVAKTVPDNTQPTPILGVSASVGFYRSSTFSESSFLYTVNRGLSLNFSVANDASNYLLTNGYWTNYPTRSFKIRVLGDGGIFEADSCLETQLNTINNESLLSTASLVVTPNGYTEGLMYSVIPNQVGTNIFRYSEDFENAVWGKSNYTIVQNTTTAPNGTLTADTLRIGIDASSVRHRFWQSIALTGVITTSYYLKKAQHRWVQLNYVTSPDLNDWANFDLENGVIGNTGVGAVASIEDVGDGWYRCILEGVGGGSNTNCEIISTNNTNSGRYPAYQSSVAEDVCYVWGAQLVYGSTVTNYLPTSDRAIINGTIGDLTVTRATTGTRVNSDGLIEEVPYNIFTRSEEFELSNWIKNLVTISNTLVTAPNGRVFARTFQVGIDAAAGRHRTIQQFTPGVIGEIYTFSVYAKKRDHRWIQLNFTLGFSINDWANFDLETGTIGNKGSVDTICSIEDVGGGWYRLSVTGTVAVTTACSAEILVINNTNSGRYPSYQSLTADNVFDIYGAQLVKGSQVKDYLKTITRVNIPRIDYSNGSCPSILVEPQRTNLTLRSNQFSEATWAKTNLTAVDNAEIGIDGNLSASLITTSATGNFLFQSLTVTPGQIITFSFYVKRGTMTDLRYRFRDQTNNVDLLIGSYYSQTNSTTFTRISVTLTMPAGCTSFRFAPIQDTNSIGTCYITSAQAELGSNATSYIPTTTATVTRNADVITKVGATNLIGQTEGSVYCEIPFTQVKGAGRVFLSFSTDAANWVRFRIQTDYTNSINFQSEWYVNSVFINQANGTVSRGASSYKILFTYGIGKQVQIYCNGVKISSSNPIITQLPLFNTIELGHRGTGSQINESVKSYVIYKTALTDTQAINLTTL